jgi:hypothetical protein
MFFFGLSDVHPRQINYMDILIVFKLLRNEIAKCLEIRQKGSKILIQFDGLPNQATIDNLVCIFTNFTDCP